MIDTDAIEERSARIMAALRQRRKNLGLPQRVIADEMEMTRTTVSRLEHTVTPRFVTLLKYCEALDMVLVPVAKELVD